MFDGICNVCSCRYLAGIIDCYSNCASCYGNPCFYVGCFLSDTDVLTPDGALPIQELAAGDAVLSLYEDGAVAAAAVTRVIRTIAPGYLIINGTLRVTDHHPFHVRGEWKEARHLVVGDVLDAIGGEIPIVSIERVEKPVRAFNIEVGGDHTFYANGMLVHNKPPDPEG